MEYCFNIKLLSEDLKLKIIASKTKDFLKNLKRKSGGLMIKLAKQFYSQ